MTDEPQDEEAKAPGAESLLAEGREAICTALEAVADEQQARPKLVGLLLELKDEVEAGHRPENMWRGRANFVFRITDDYWRRRWDGISEDPPQYPEDVNGIARMYWARRVSFEWRFPGKWQISHTV